MAKRSIFLLQTILTKIDDALTLQVYKANWMSQFSALFWRSSIQNITEPMLIQVRLWETIVRKNMLENIN